MPYHATDQKVPMAILLLTQCNGETYHVLPNCTGYHERGIASWYGTKFHGGRTSDGETYDMYAMTAASKVLPLPCYVRVTNLENGKSVIVKVNDRGPFVENRIIDLSYAAAAKHRHARNRHGTGGCGRRNAWRVIADHRARQQSAGAERYTAGSRLQR